MSKAMKDIRTLKAEALDKRLDDSRHELMKLRSQVATGTVPKNSAQIRTLRKTIARILTVQNMKTEVKAKK